MGSPSRRPVKMKGLIISLGLIYIFVIGNVQAEPEQKSAKAISLFSVVKFPNSACTGTSDTTRNGTCYTAEECSNKGGTNAGSCADGYGVCCVVSLSCGETSTSNNSYLILSSTTSPQMPECAYKLCPSSPDVCRIRLDFTTFDIGDPQTGTAGSTTTTTAGGAIGHCTTDRFTFAAMHSGNGSPVICGDNKGQHMIVDVMSNECAAAVFSFGASTTTTRSFDIRVTHFECNSEKGGPPGCLQYYTGNTGTVQSFNYPIGSTSLGSTVTHLANQRYTICMRRESGKCSICYFPSVSPSSASSTAQASFGLSTSSSTTASSGDYDATCGEDYIIIPYGTTATIAATFNNNLNSFNPSVRERICGRFLGSANPSDTLTAHATVCSGFAPFNVLVNFDESEILASTTTDPSAAENSGVPGGFVGFSLDFTQVDCT